LVGESLVGESLVGQPLVGWKHRVGGQRRAVDRPGRQR
jgi:hypothetical protein